jgi:hypothetical protein
VAGLGFRLSFVGCGIVALRVFHNSTFVGGENIGFVIAFDDFDRAIEQFGIDVFNSGAGLGQLVLELTQHQ